MSQGMQGHRGMYADGGGVKQKPGMTVPADMDFGGVQPWSAGDLFPGTVIGRGLPGGSHGYQGVYMHADNMNEWDRQPIRRTYDEARQDALAWLKRLGIKRFDSGGDAGGDGGDAGDAGDADAAAASVAAGTSDVGTGTGSAGSAAGAADGSANGSSSGADVLLARMLGGQQQNPMMMMPGSLQGMGWGRRGGWWMGGMAGGGHIPQAMREHALHLADGGAATYDTSAPMKRHRGQHRPSSWHLAEPGISAEREAQVGFGGGSHQYDGYTRGGNQLTQGAIDSVRASPLRSLLENAVGNSPSSISQMAQKRMLPSPALGGLQAMLYSGDAMAPSLYDEPYEGHGKWQPFERLR